MADTITREQLRHLLDAAWSSSESPTDEQAHAMAAAQRFLSAPPAPALAQQAEPAVPTGDAILRLHAKQIVQGLRVPAEAGHMGDSEYWTAYVDGMLESLDELPAAPPTPQAEPSPASVRASEVAESITVIRQIMEFIRVHDGKTFDPALAEKRVNARLDKIAAALLAPEAAPPAPVEAVA